MLPHDHRAIGAVAQHRLSSLRYYIQIKVGQELEAFEGGG
jgi:hypothetical protein